MQNLFYLKDFLPRDELYCIHNTIKLLDNCCGMCNQLRKENEKFGAAKYCKTCLCKKRIKNYRSTNYPRWCRTCDSCDHLMSDVWYVNMCLKCKVLHNDD
jgi:hypothetical protein